MVDGHSVFAEALALAIDTTDELTCVGTARDVEQALELAGGTRPDVAVMDVQPNGTDPVHRRAPPRAPSRAPGCSSHRSAPRPVTGPRGAADAGRLRAPPQVHQPGRRRRDDPRPAPAGLRARPGEPAGALCAAPRRSVRARRRAAASSPLTRRERDILVLLASGVDLQRAAARLGITVNTARGYVKNLYRKLGVHNQLELVGRGPGAGLLDTTRVRPSAGRRFGRATCPTVSPSVDRQWHDGARVRVRTG